MNRQYESFGDPDHPCWNGFKCRCRYVNLPLIMKTPIIVLFSVALIAATGCAIPSSGPTVKSERFLLDGHHLDDPSLECAKDLKKVYYVIKDVEGDESALVLLGCLSEQHIELLDTMDSNRTSKTVIYLPPVTDP